VRELIERERARFRVPGVAVAVVADGRVLLADAFGVADAATREPLTADHSLAIGSITKSFTATLVATLVGEGRLDWDRPLRLDIPGLELADPVATQLLTLRDVLCHRSGMPSHEWVWYRNQQLTRAQVLERLGHLEFNRGLRTSFQYNNLMYVLAGHAVESVTGQSWEEALHGRLLGPLGLTATTFGPDRANRASSGHDLKDDTVVRVPYVLTTDAIGPAGTIWSTPADMGQWLLLQLQAYGTEPSEVVNPSLLREAHSAQMAVQLPELDEVCWATSYGLGWYRGIYRGEPYVYHGGDIQGFTAMAGFLPRKGFGAVVLANRSGTWVNRSILFNVLDKLLGHEGDDWSGKLEAFEKSLRGTVGPAPQTPPGPAPVRPLPEYSGLYASSGYGSFEVALKESRLIMNFEGRTAGLSHRHHEVFDIVPEDGQASSLAMSFASSEQGSIVGFSVPLEPSVAPISFHRVGDPRLCEPLVLDAYTGRYVREGLVVNVRRVHARLVAESSMRPPLVLVPAAEHVFTVDGSPHITIQFTIDPNGELVIQPTGGTFTRE
jgi:CubicO group peptidase (beta-lactamase class C family)